MVPVAKRLKFRKIGALKYISHLDLCRTMKSAFLRAGIPIYYSEGFNPHPKMVFGLTLSIGAESECELLDIKITEEMSDNEIKERMNKSLTDELYVYEVYTPDNKLTDIAYASYELDFENGFDISALDKSELVIEKQTKKGDMKQVDIKPLIKSYSQNGNKLCLTLTADGDNYLNPEFPASFVAPKDAEHTVMRTKIFDKAMKEFR